jgi:signal transduction histidine kinase
VKVCVQHAGDAATLQVIDEGPGVAIADRERIFQPFARGRATRGTGGAGIGLAVVSQVVAAHGGHVTVDDAPGRGARFSVHLPARTLATDS